MNERSAQVAKADSQPSHKKPYQAPALSLFGQVALLTQAGSCAESNDNDTFSCNPISNKGMNASDRRLKSDIVRIGEHPLGLGLYLFNYRPEVQAQWGYGRQFGVMADEVEQVCPEAVAKHPDGYLMVSYDKLGIRRALH